MTIKISDEVRAKAQADLDAIAEDKQAKKRTRLGVKDGRVVVAEEAPARWRLSSTCGRGPSNPRPNTLAGCFLLAIRTMQELHPGTRDLRNATARLWQAVKPGGFMELKADLRILMKLIESNLIAGQRPLGGFGSDHETHWWALKTPYWEPGDPPALIMPARKKRRPSKAKPHQRYSNGKNVQVNP